MFIALDEDDVRKDRLLESLASDTIATLTLVLSSNPDFWLECCDAIFRNTSVTRLVLLGGNGLMEEELIHLMKAFQGLQSRLTTLHITGDLPPLLLPTILWQFRELVELKVETTEMHPTTIAPALAHHATLRSIELNAPTTSLVMEALVTAPHLETVELGAAGAPWPVSALTVLLGAPSLTHLYVKGAVDATPYGWMLLGQSVAQSQLEELALICANLGSDDLERFVEGMQGAQETLRTLNLRGNRFLDSPSAVSTLLSRLPVLEELDIGDCGHFEVNDLVDQHATLQRVYVTLSDFQAMVLTKDHRQSPVGAMDF